MPFPPKLLNEGEEVVLDLHPHWWFFAGPVAAVVFMTIVAAASFNLHEVFRIGAVGVLLFVLGWFGVRYAKWVTTNFVVTTDRLIFRHGVLSKRGIEIPLDRVNTVFFSQSLFERLVGAGDLVIESAGELGREHFTDIRKPSLVQNMIYRQIEANENRKFDRLGAATGGVPAPGPGDSIPEQIEKLDELRRRGVLTDAEFQAKKTQLLDRM
jgi:membrane protein YdbS with pleckstrin-like domain